MKIIKLGLLTLLLMQVSQCGSSFPLNEDSFLKRPNGLEVTAISGKSFIISFYIQNEEVSFDGYNLYISKSSISDGEINSAVLALSLNGSLPTFSYSVANFDLDNAKSHTISFYNDPPVNFETGISYFFRLAARSYTGLLSQASNETTAIGLP